VFLKDTPQVLCHINPSLYAVDADTPVQIRRDVEGQPFHWHFGRRCRLWCGIDFPS
jgi:hypothetical protein